jgi:ubiquinol-cytochrome c reductase cytochrome b/c1 subunit
MAHESSYVPRNVVEKWLDDRLPIIRWSKDSPDGLPDAEEPQLLVDLRRHPRLHAGGADHHRRHPGDALHPACQPGLRLRRAHHARREYGWLLRYLHSNGASMFFAAVYIHIFRGLYYGSYKAPREVLWILGVIIFLLMMATAFMGYVLPWGQMSFWGATVITNLFSAIPVVGETIVTCCGAAFGRQPDAQPLLLAALPAAVHDRGVVVLHIWALHVPGNNNPIGVEVKSRRTRCPSTPYYTMKDLFAMVVLLHLLRLVRVLRRTSWATPTTTSWRTAR